MENILHSGDALIGLMGVLFGSLLTTFGVWLTNRSNAKNLLTQLKHEEVVHRQRASKERLEELYILVSHWQNGMFANYLHLTLVMKGETDYNQYLDSVIKLGSENGMDFSRVEMIVGVYGTQLKNSYEAALVAREALNAISLNHKRAYKRSEPGDGFLPAFNEAQSNLDAVCDALKQAIADAARRA